ncbi:MAG TPA: hypothetical protein VHU77_08835 [Candidatus Limnocylindria bacterium]|nr:hypothetical protein [Candidatus Limnocylindria bacterium]
MATPRRHRAFGAAISLATACAIAILLTSSALAGGWASATLDQQPDDPGAGGTLTMGFTLLQHGVTPVDWGEPLVTLSDAASGVRVSAVAHPSGKVGHWVADLRVPAAGTWTLEIRHDLQIAPLNFEPIVVGGGAGTAAAAASSSPSLALTAAAGFMGLLALASAGIGLVAWRRGRSGQLAA